jgi:hypothetical protein
MLSSKILSWMVGVAMIGPELQEGLQEGKY